MSRTIPLTPCQYLVAVLLHQSSIADSKLMLEVPGLFDIFRLHYLCGFPLHTAKAPRENLWVVAYSPGQLNAGRDCVSVAEGHDRVE